MELKQGAFLQDEKYRIIRTLGQGGFGITYLAEQVLAGRMVCIKEFFPKEYYNRDADSRHITVASQSNVDFMERFKEKFMKEAKTIARLDHPNIIHIHDVFKENNTGYYVMEYIEGISLYDMVRRNGVLSVEVATQYIREVAAALEHIHGQRINHLDIKPGNIMVRKSDNRAILIDFGLSKQYDEAGNQTSSTPVGISQGFAPMEQYKAGGVSEFSPTSDIYSLGATLFYLLTATVPPMASDIVENGLPALIQQLPTNIKRAIESSMEVRRRDRPQTVADFLKILDGAPVASPATEFVQPRHEAPNKAFATPRATPTPPPTPRYYAPAQESPKKRSGGGCLWIMIILLVIIGSAIGIGGWLIFGHNQDKTPTAQDYIEYGEPLSEEFVKYLTPVEECVTETTAEAPVAECAAEAPDTEATEEAPAAEPALSVEDMIHQEKLNRQPTNGVYQIGDYYYNEDGKEGVVFDVWNGGRNGKIVSLNQVMKSWSKQSVVTNANDHFDGWANRYEITHNFDSAQYPAFQWCQQKGSSWYLPSEQELRTIYNNMGSVNIALRNNGGKTITQGAIYWSSTEYSDSPNECAHVVPMTSDYSGRANAYKYFEFWVVAVATF